MELDMLLLLARTKLAQMLPLYPGLDPARMLTKQ
nr:hypothetical protein Q903MT_gene4447 [Picea sitchensis]